MLGILIIFGLFLVTFSIPALLVVWVLSRLWKQASRKPKPSEPGA